MFRHRLSSTPEAKQALLGKGRSRCGGLSLQGQLAFVLRLVSGGPRDLEIIISE